MKIDGSRLWQSLMDLAQIGATPLGGVRRITLTDLDRQGRDSTMGPWSLWRSRQAANPGGWDATRAWFASEAGLWWRICSSD